MNDEQRKVVLRNIILMRMETISQLKECRFILEETGFFSETKINILLDRLNNLKKLEQELNE